MSKKNKYDYYFIKKWRKETREKIKLVRPDLDDDRLDKYLDDQIEKNFKDHKCTIVNTHKGKSADTSLLQIIEFIHDTKPITAGHGVLFHNQYVVYNPSAQMLATLKKDRDILKNERKKFDERSYEFLTRDIGQDNKKRLMNSFYGAMGAKTSTFYNLYTAASITGTGQALISLAETSYEQFLENNTKFYDMDEFLLFVHRVVNKTTYKYFDDIVPDIDDIYEKTRAWILSSFMYDPKVYKDMVDTVLSNLSPRDLHKLYFKNNLIAFFKEIPEVIRLTSHIVNHTEKFRNPNKVPEEIAEDLNLLWDFCYEIVCNDFPIRNRIERDKYHKRRACITQDTDSTMLTISRLVDLFILDFIEDDVAAETDDDLLFIIVNTIAFFLGKWSKAFLWRYGEDCNIPDEFRTFNIKNEFFYPLMVLTSTKKRYLTLMKLQEGKVIDPMKIDVHGLDFAKAETSDMTKSFFDNIIKKDIMFAEEINVPKIFKQIKDFEEIIRESIHNGEVGYLSIKSVKEPEAYDEPWSEQGIKAVTNWNLAYPEMSISLPDRIFIIKIDAEKRKKFDEIAHKIPDKIRQTYIDKIFNNPEPKISKQGLTVIALPQNIDKIPEWMIEIADIQTMIDDNVSKFNPILMSLGNVPVKTRSQSIHMSNIIDL